MKSRILYLSVFTCVLLAVVVLMIQWGGKELAEESVVKAEGKSSVTDSNYSMHSKGDIVREEAVKDKIKELCYRYNQPFFFDAAAEEARLEIPASMRQITGLDKDRSYRSRMNGIRELRGKLSGRNLSKKEIEALLSFLHKDPKTEKLSLLEIDAIKNDVFCLLMDQKRKDIHLSEELVAMYHDKSLGSVWCEYCIQFIGQWYKKAPEEKRDVMQYTLNEALEDGKGEVRGTALLWMSRLVDTGDFERAEISEKAYKECTLLSTDDKVKMTAFQVAAKFKHPEIAKLARTVINDKASKNVLLKMSAIATIGETGDMSDMIMLGKLAKSSDVRLRTPARAAMKKLEEVR